MYQTSIYENRVPFFPQILTIFLPLEIDFTSFSENLVFLDFHTCK